MTKAAYIPNRQKCRTPKGLRAALAGVAVAAVLSMGAGPAPAQSTPGAVLADAIRVQNGSQLIAEGNVEVIYGTARLTASRITYDQNGGTLLIDGPITLVDGKNAEAVILASSAELDDDLRNGILTSARLVLNQQLQLAAVQIDRVDGRYTQLYKTVASACQVCAENPVPLWSIRASRVIHDAEEQQLYFHDAQFRIMDVPVLYLPRMRLPDPTLERSTGFLLPSARTTTNLGPGLKLPYFIALGDHQDITLTPYIATEARALEMRYRRAFANGTVTFNGAVAGDDVRPDQLRGYLFGEGEFDLAGGFKLNFDIETTSDPAFLLEYGYSDKDRLDSAIEITRTREGDNFQAALINYRTLRASEIPIQDELPYLVGEVVYERRFSPSVVGGMVNWELSLQGLERKSTDDGVGRDVLRVGAASDWSRDFVLPMGLVLGTEASAELASYVIGQDSGYEQLLTRATPTVATSLSMPMVKVENGGAAQTLTPIAQVAWSQTYGPDVPNEDSTLVEFDEGNLIALSRFPGRDRHASGAQGALGLDWTRLSPDGWSFGVTAGRIWRLDSSGEYTAGSGLSGDSSDWLAAGYLTLPDGFRLDARALFDTDLSVTKGEARMALDLGRFDVGSSYIFQIADPDEGRDTEVHELALDSDFRISDRWSGSMDWRYDFTTDRAASAGLGLNFKTECVSVDVSLSRRFTSSSDLTPSTDIGVAVSLVGFGASGDAAAPVRQCRG